MLGWRAPVWLRRGMNPVQLAQLLGHSGLRMIQQVYAPLNPTAGYEAVMRMLTNERWWRFWGCDWQIEPVSSRTS
jgi:hypothetical protein